MHFGNSASAMQKLAVKWHVIGLLALAFARLLRRYEDASKPGTAELAAELELTARAAQVLVWQDIQAQPPPQSPGDEHALAHLRLIALCLLALIHIAASIRARAPSAACWMQTRCSGSLPGAQGFAAPFTPAAFLDSS